MHSPFDTKHRNVELTLFVPCLNEERHVCQTLQAVVDAMQVLGFSYEIIVVDDGSTDNTGEVVKQFHRSHPDVPLRLVKNPRNLGLAHSYVETAFRANGTYYALIWGDAAWDEAHLISILKPLGTVDMVVPYGRGIVGKPWHRRLISASYTLIVNTFSGNSLKYYNGGAVLRTEHVTRWAPRNLGFSGFFADLITRLLDQGATYTEVPYAAVHAAKGSGNGVLTLKNFASTGGTLLSILARRLRKIAFGNQISLVDQPEEVDLQESQDPPLARAA